MWCQAFFEVDVHERNTFLSPSHFGFDSEQHLCGIAFADDFASVVDDSASVVDGYVSVVLGFASDAVGYALYGAAVESDEEDFEFDSVFAANDFGFLASDEDAEVATAYLDVLLVELGWSIALDD